MGLPNGTFGRTDVAVPDTDRAKHFYTNLFGWTAVETPAGDPLPYTKFMLGEKSNGGIIRPHRARSR